MYFPEQDDYIDIHIHGGKPAEGVFMLESLMAHEDIKVKDLAGIAYTYGIHPWFLDEDNYEHHLISVKTRASDPSIIAIGEAGFDKLRGPSVSLQRKVFEEQVLISETHQKPLVIHCVRGWDELLSVHKILKPRMPWLIHGFRGSLKLAEQLISKGMYLSIWFDFVLKSESAELLSSIPDDRLFLETDGADVDIKDIYNKVSNDRKVRLEELKRMIQSNYKRFFNIKSI